MNVYVKIVALHYPMGPHSAPSAAPEWKIKILVRTVARRNLQVQSFVQTVEVLRMVGVVLRRPCQECPLPPHRDQMPEAVRGN